MDSINSTKPRYCRAKETAAIYRISESTLWNWVKNRKGFPKPKKIGERVTLFDLNEIELFLKSQFGE